MTLPPDPPTANPAQRVLQGIYAMLIGVQHEAVVHARDCLFRDPVACIECERTLAQLKKYRGVYSQAWHNLFDGTAEGGW